LAPDREVMSVLSQADLTLWYQRLGLSEDARTAIDRIRSSEPARRVGGGKSNVCGRYPSRKMGKIIQFESHRVEFAAALEMEDDTATLEYYDQPCQIPLNYHDGRQRKISVTHTPDFFVLRTASAGWVECKTDEDLVKLAQKSAHRVSGAR
jgi:putative transposase